MLQFNDKDHKYYWNGKEVPSVTQILKEVGIIDTRFYNIKARERGKDIHSLCHDLDDCSIDWAAIKLGYLPYLRAYQLFKEENDIEWDLVEEPMYNATWGYSGTPDRFGTVNGKSTLMDIKTGGREKWHELQGCAYMQFPEIKINENVRLLCLYLHNNGKYTPVYHYPENSLKYAKIAFQGACNVYQWKKGSQ